MTYLNAKKYIFSAPEHVAVGKSELPILLDRLGAPQRRLKYLRLAGSNGKTVCAEMLRSVLLAADYSVGCLRLPLYQEPRENICIGEASVAMEEFSEYTAAIRELCVQNNISLTRQELILAIALLAFKSAQCNICILECGDEAEPLGALPPPFGAVICGTIPSEDKAAIAKIRSYLQKGISELVAAPQDSAALKFLQDTCYGVGCRLTIPQKSAQSVQRLNFRGSEFTYKSQSYSLKLCGKFQIFNAILSLETVEMLARHGYKITPSNVRAGLSTLKIPAKFEVISLSPLIIVDSTHSPVAIETVCDSLADFKEGTAKSVLLCLPSGEIIDRYINALGARGYDISRVLTVGGADTDKDAHAVITESCKNPRALVKRALAELDGDTVLLISGEYPFVAPIRYELLAALGF